MTRNRDDFEEQNVGRAFAELREGIDPPADDELRALARAASAAPERRRRRANARGHGCACARPSPRPRLHS